MLRCLFSVGINVHKVSFTPNAIKVGPAALIRLSSINLCQRFCHSQDMDQVTERKPSRATHVIFDLDGTLLDSISTYRSAINMVISNSGKSVAWNQMPRILQEPTLTKALQVVKHELNLEITIDEFVNSYNQALSQIMEKTPLMPGALGLLNYLKKKQVPLGLCTSLSSKMLSFETQHLKDVFTLGNYFEVITAAEDDPEVVANKPGPDPYIVTMKRFKIKPSDSSHVLVFEDSPEGVQSALAAGTQCIMLCDKRMQTKHVDSVPCIHSFAEFKPELYELL